MEGNIVISCHSSPSYQDSIVQWKYLKNKNSDLGILTVLEILGEKKIQDVFGFGGAVWFGLVWFFENFF